MGWEVFALTTVALFAKQVVLVAIQAGDRMRTQTFRHAEDAKMLNGNHGEAPLTKRAQAVINNSLENEPMFLIVLFAFLAIHAGGDFNPSRSYAESAVLYAEIFVGARWLHMILFLWKKAGIRTLAFGVGFFATFGLCVRIVLDLTS